MRLRVPSPEPGLTPDEAAAHWLVRLDAGDLSETERAAFDRWHASSAANARAFAAAESAWGVFDLDLPDPHLSAIREAARNARPARWRWWPAAGAALAASLAAGLFLVAQPDLGTGGLRPAADPQAPAASGAPASAGAGSAITRKGEQKVVALPDGSKVILNTDSAIETAFSAKLRRVRLLRGQALFEVAKDAGRPFVVSAADRQITALGTKFEVRLDPGKMQVLLVEGKVRIDKTAESGESSPVEPTTLAPGQELVAELGSAQQVHKADVGERLLWTKGYVVFDDATLGEVVSEMNRYSDRGLRIEDSELAPMRLSGVFRTGDPERFAAILGELLPVEARADASGDVVLRQGRSVPRSASPPGSPGPG